MYPVWISVARGKCGGCMKENRTIHPQASSKIRLSQRAGVGLNDAKHRLAAMVPNWRRPFTSRFSLALGVALLPLFSAVALAENYPLESVDFTSTGDQTNIILHTGSIVPVQKVLVSRDKLVLEIDQVDATETIRTNFTGAANISHVILQPVNDHKIRMIIRGERLGVPTLAFYNANNGAYNLSNSSYNASNAAETASRSSVSLPPAESGAQSAMLALPSHQAEPLPSETAPSNAAEMPSDAAAWETGAKTIMPPSATGQAAGSLPAAKMPLSLPASPTQNAVEWLNQLMSGPLNTVLPYALLGSLLLGLGVFIRHKFIQMGLGQKTPALEDLLEEQSGGKRLSFREMADAYRHKHDLRNDEEAMPTPRSNKNAARKNSADDVIGLQSLHQLDASWEEPASLPQALSEERAMPLENTNPAASLEQLLSALQKNAAPKKPIGKTSPPAKQAVHQYAQTQPAKPATKNAPSAASAAPNRQQMANAKMLAAQKLQQETTRANQLQQDLAEQVRLQQMAAQQTQPTTPVNRAKAAQKSVKPYDFKTAPATHPVNAKKSTAFPTPAKSPASKVNVARNAAQQGPLPGNPEVLNFLRNVAELMEKDGKTEIAKNIHKNLSSQNPGRL